MELANLSVLLVWGAATALAIALIAFSADLARLSSARVEARDVDESRQRIAVGVGAAGASTLTPPVERRGREVEQVRSTNSVNRQLAGIGMSLTWLAMALLLVAVVLRGIAAGRTPWANMYEFTLVGTFVAVTVFTLVNTRRDVRYLGAFVTGIAVLFLVLAQTKFFIVATGVPPALQKYWLVIHVGVATCATGIFTIAFVMSVLQLMRSGRENGSALLGSRWWGWLDHTPTPTTLEGLSFRLNSVAFVLWTFTVIGGAIWAEDAWGRYWGWDPKEVWSFIVWVVYAAYLHARTTRGWSGNAAAWFVVAGYACVLFNFTGVNLIFSGKHSYSGL